MTISILGRLPQPDTPSQRVTTFDDRIPAGFPSPAADHVERCVDLNEHLIADVVSTYLVRVSGDSMVGVGIYDGDELVVQRGLEPRPGDVVIATVGGDLTVKCFELGKGGVMYLAPRNPRYAPILIDESVELWGVVTSSIRHHRRR